MGLFKKDVRRGYVLFNESYMDSGSTIPYDVKSFNVIVKGKGKDQLRVKAVPIPDNISSITHIVAYVPSRLLTQNNRPIVAKPYCGEIIKKDWSDSFTKEGFEVGQLYAFYGVKWRCKNLNDEIVYLVTDQLVFFNSVSDKYSIKAFTYEELQLLKENNQCKLIKTS